VSLPVPGSQRKTSKAKAAAAAAAAACQGKVLAQYLLPVVYDVDHMSAWGAAQHSKGCSSAAANRTASARVWHTVHAARRTSAACSSYTRGQQQQWLQQQWERA
jgi:hypothetical protein